jgi:hypothetical protein
MLHPLVLGAQCLQPTSTSQGRKGGDDLTFEPERRVRPDDQGAAGTIAFEVIPEIIAEIRARLAEADAVLRRDVGHA